MDELQPILAQLGEYGELIFNGLLVMFGGMVAVLLLYRLMASLIKPGGTYARVMRVAFGAVYMMILVVTVLLAADRIGMQVDGLAGIAILAVIVGAVLVFFLIPFLPRIPFVPGNMVQIKDIMGVVEAVTAYQIVLRTFDGQTVFIPTPIAMASPIRNFSLSPDRRVELNVEINAGDNIEAARALLLEIMATNELVLSDPEPSVFVTGIAQGKASMLALCWVENANWFGTRDALWVAVVSAVNAIPDVNLALPQLQLYEDRVI